LNNISKAVLLAAGTAVVVAPTVAVTASHATAAECLAVHAVGITAVTPTTLCV